MTPAMYTGDNDNDDDDDTGNDDAKLAFVPTGGSRRSTICPLWPQCQQTLIAPTQTQQTRPDPSFDHLNTLHPLATMHMCTVISGMRPT